MKILLYGLNYAPEAVGTGRYSGELGAWLAAQGHRVRVIAAPPYYPAWRVSAGAKRWWRRETLEGVRVTRVPLYVPRRPRGLTRMLHLGSFASFVGGLEAAAGAAEGEHRSSMVLSASVLISCILAMIMALAGGLAGLPLPALALYQVAWAVLAMIFPLIQRY